MTNGEILDQAVRLTGETSTADSPDYSDRSKSLLALLYRTLAPLDRDIRAANDLPAQGNLPSTVLPTGIFPLTDQLAPAVAYALASLLTIDENLSLSETMQKHFADAIVDVRARIPMKSGSTRNVYPGIL